MSFQNQAKLPKPKFKTKKKVDETKVKSSSGDKLVSNENWNKTAQHAHIFIIILCSPTHLDADHSFAVAKWLFYPGPTCFRWRHNINDFGLVRVHF